MIPRYYRRTVQAGMPMIVKEMGAGGWFHAKRQPLSLCSMPCLVLSFERPVIPM